MKVLSVARFRVQAVAAAALVVAWACPSDARAHADPAAPVWRVDVLFLGFVALVSLLFATGHVRRARRAQPGRLPHARQGWAFGLCVVSLVLALASPLDRYADLTFAAHMTQHELLMLLAAPLLTLARPLDTYLWLLPARARGAVWRGAPGRWLLASLDLLTRPLVAVLLHAAIRWLWHIPLLFEAALRDERVHAIQHASFFFSAVLFWWGIVHGRYGRAGYGAAALFVMFTAVHTGGLGALLTLGETSWYPLYEPRARSIGVDPLLDQQLAGLVMWVGAGIWLTFVALGLFLAWLGEARLRSARGMVGALVAARSTGSVPP